jgi:hypothetical protein
VRVTDQLWYDRARNATPHALISQNADVLTHHTDSTAVTRPPRRRQIRVRLSLRHVEVRAEGAAERNDASLGRVHTKTMNEVAAGT